MNEAPSFVMVEIAWPGFHLRFLATQKRIDRLLSLITPEVLESELDFKATTSQKLSHEDEQRRPKPSD